MITMKTNFGDEVRSMIAGHPWPPYARVIRTPCSL